MEIAEKLDFIGDIHGNAQKLLTLLNNLGYVHSSVGWSHSEGRQIVVLGDFINVGNDSKLVLQILFEMWSNNVAKIIIGNHEYYLAWYFYQYGNAIFEKNGPLEKDYEKLLNEFRDDTDLFKKYVEWILTLPLFIETVNYRAVHAYWSKENQKIISKYRNLEEIFKAFEILKKKKSNELKYVINETIIGKQVVLNPSCRNKNALKFRIKWWINIYGKLLPECIVIHKSVQCPGIIITPSLLPGFKLYDSLEKPIFFGHYWLQRKPYLLSNNICCLDFGAAKGGYLAAYRWNGETSLNENNLIWV